MLVLPVVASASIAGVGFVHVVFFIVDIPCGFTVTMSMILSYKFYFAFFYDMKRISITCMNTSIDM